MSNETLFDFAKSRGHQVLYMDLDENKAVTIEDDHYSIVLANGLSRTDEKELTAHELGHCEYGGTYCRHSKYDIKARAEYRANKWAYYQLVSPDEIADCVSRGIVTSWELAEYFDVSCEFITKAIEYFKLAGIM